MCLQRRTRFSLFFPSFPPLPVHQFHLQVLPISSPSPALMFSFVLIINKHSLAASSELIG